MPRTLRFNRRNRSFGILSSRRLTPRQYLGITYDYGRTVVSSPIAPIETQLHTPLPFYTFYLNHTSSISFAGGMQYTSVNSGPGAGIQRLDACGIGKLRMASEPRGLRSELFAYCHFRPGFIWSVSIWIKRGRHRLLELQPHIERCSGYLLYDHICLIAARWLGLQRGRHFYSACLDEGRYRKIL